ncbi:MAG: Cell division trigger factor (EC [uncultured Thiotrichaceae bacterium]|uniref:Trigger factor n=1 Tax=uncultured Thiotrichaceae bacterium TaxID=298394 RepID=A0A6S6TTD0_9GAMM|nr:MAG: Cell division trigger factor (EC [uncultured Thiotrichaceae bacterium]
MQVSVENTGNIERKMTVTLPAERIDQEVDKRLKSMRGRVRIDGFRPGKVPFTVVKQRYGASVHQEVVGDAVQESFSEAATQQELRVAGLPSIDMDGMQLGEPLEYTATFQVYPEFEVGDVSTLEVTRPTAEIGEEDIDKMVEVIRDQQKVWNDVERAVADKDQVTVDFVGSLDGELFDGGSAEDFVVELGAGRMLPDFEAALIGMSVGEEKEADVSFPDEYQAENLAGKTAQFKLTVKSVQESAQPELNEEFIKQFGVEDGSVETFRAEVKNNMQRELSNALKTRIKQQVMDGLSALHDIEMPDALVTDEVKHVRDEFAQNMKNQGMDGASAANLPDDLFKPQAERRVKLGLIVGEIIRQKEMQRDQARVDAMLETLAASYEEPSALIEYYKTNPQAMQTVEAAVMEEMIVDWVMDTAQVIDEPSDFDSIMNPKQDVAEEADGKIEEAAVA